jgi:hypothetical protein
MREPGNGLLMALQAGEFHDQGDAKWIVITGQLKGHKDTPLGRPTAPRGWPPSGRNWWFKLLLIMW